jgi:hypothetical protein
MRGPVAPGPAFGARFPARWRVTALRRWIDCIRSATWGAEESRVTQATPAAGGCRGRAPPVEAGHRVRADTGLVATPRAGSASRPNELRAWPAEPDWLRAA